jgi:tripartite-type tricarboxylate transporter receptor subunit TctC
MRWLCFGRCRRLQATAQSYPQKSIRLIVPLAPGGGNDTIARLVGQRFHRRLATRFVVDNRPGAGGLIAAEWSRSRQPTATRCMLGNVGCVDDLFRMRRRRCHTIRCVIFCRSA